MEPLPLSTSSTESGNKNYRETTSALEPHNILTRLARNNKFSEIEPLLLAYAPQSQETKIAVKQLLLWSHTTY